MKGMTFVPYLSEAEITKQVNRVAQEIVESLGDEKSPIFVCVLNGAYVFAADLFRACNLPEAEITFIRFKSYEGTSSTGVVNEVMGLAENLEGRDVIIIEDIVDTGVTAKALREAVKGGKASREELVALGKQVFDEVKASIAPEAQRVITKNLGSFDEYLTKYIEATVLEIKQNEPYITLPESALIEGEAER